MTDASWEAVPPGEGSPHFENTTPRMTLDECFAVFRRWLGEKYDTDALAVVLAVAAVERLDGDPLWALLVSGSGNAKTETVQTLAGVGALVISSIASQGALLSATSKRERSDEATGGLLREVGERGVLVIKDFTTILTQKSARDEVLAALREIYDGSWRRDVGTDGGRSLEWAGRLGLVGAVTTAWDTAHAVIATMGDRFVLVRMDSRTDRLDAARRATANIGHEKQMRSDLANAAAGVLANMDASRAVIQPEQQAALHEAANLVTLSRTGVEYAYDGSPEYAHDPEMPTRFGKQLAQVMRGALALGYESGAAHRLALRCARDSMPPLRLEILEDIADNPGSTVSDVRGRLNKPRKTLDRQLQSLQMLDLLTLTEATESVGIAIKQVWRYRLAEGVEVSAVRS